VATEADPLAGLLDSKSVSFAGAEIFAEEVPFFAVWKFPAGGAGFHGGFPRVESAVFLAVLFVIVVTVAAAGLVGEVFGKPVVVSNLYDFVGVTVAGVFKGLFGNFFLGGSGSGNADCQKYKYETNSHKNKCTNFIIAKFFYFMKRRGFKLLIDDVKKSIVEAGFQYGEKMPSVRKMAERMNLSVNTVHRVYKLLALEKMVQLVHGKGCFWGAAPSFDVEHEKSVYSVIEQQFQKDLDGGYLKAFQELPSCKELSHRYKVSPYVIKKFLLQKTSQGVLRRVGYRFIFSEERTIERLNYVLFVHRSDELGCLKIESEREFEVFRAFAHIAAEQSIAVKFVGYHEATNRFYESNGNIFSVMNEARCLGVFLSTWLISDASKLFAHFASFKNPISVWWEYPPDSVPTNARNKKKWAFYNVAFGKEAGVIVGDYLNGKKMGSVHFLSPYHASFWSKARLQGLLDAGADVIPLVDERFASPFDLIDRAKEKGVGSQELLNDVLGALLKSATLDKFVCSNDWVAASVIDYYRARQMPVPYVIGFDDSIESYRYVFDSFAFNVGTMVQEAIYHIVAPSIYAEQRRQMQAPLGRVVEKYQSA